MKEEMMSIDWKKLGPTLSDKSCGPEPTLDHIVRTYYHDRLDDAAHATRVAKQYMSDYD